MRPHQKIGQVNQIDSTSNSWNPCIYIYMYIYIWYKLSFDKGSSKKHAFQPVSISFHVPTRSTKYGPPHHPDQQISVPSHAVAFAVLVLMAMTCLPNQAKEVNILIPASIAPDLARTGWKWKSHHQMWSWLEGLNNDFRLDLENQNQYI